MERKKSKWVYDLQGNEKKSIDTLLLSETELSRLPGAVKTGIEESQRTFVSGSFSNFGLIEASGPVQHSGEQLEILNRFGKVFDLSYTRFNDLKQAEASSKEAVKQAALDRIRADIASMRTHGRSGQDHAIDLERTYHPRTSFYPMRRIYHG
jgi:hypothetical protein